MKKILLSICSILVVTVIFAQNAIMIDMSAEQVKSYVENVQPTNLQSNNSIAATQIWSEDFANGIPATWMNSTAPWVYRGPSTSPNQSTGSQGAYASNGATIASPSASNGFIIFDSDYYDNNGTPGAFGTGIYPAPHNGELMTDNVDLSTYSDVMLSFNSYYRTFAGQAFVDFYVGGVFTERVQVHANLDVNDATFTDEVALVRVPFSVTGNADVQMSFVFEGTTNTIGTPPMPGYYFWMIDDLELIETPVNLIGIEDVVVGGFWIDYANYAGSGLNGIVGLDYSITPTSQLANHPYVIEGVIRNLGSADQTSMLKYEVYGAGSYLGSSLPTSLLATTSSNSVDSVIVAATPSLSPTIGQYGVRIWAESDSAVSDTTFKMFEISDFIYAKDNGEVISTANPPNPHPSWTIGGPSAQYHFTTRYEMYADEQLYSLKAYITNASVVGSEVKAIVYEADSTATTGSLFYDESDNYTITAQDLGTWIDIPFVSPVSLFNGYAYECGVVGFQHPTDSVELGTSGESLYNGEHRLFDEFGLSTQSAGTPTWYYLTNTPMVRLNFDPSSAIVQSFNCVGTSCIDPGTGNGTYSSLSACQAVCNSTGLEETESSFSIYPNPSKGIFSIKLDAASSYDVSVYNVLGQTVVSTVISNMITTIDLSSFDKGIYTVELKDKQSIHIEKVIVE
jgi:hypothetical protein